MPSRPTGFVIGLLLAANSVSAVELAAPKLAWQVVSAPAQHVLWVNRQRDVKLRLRNVGTETWSEASEDHLAYHWRTSDGAMLTFDGMRSLLPRPVPPGETVEVNARVLAPAKPGRYALEWEMVREGVKWFGPPQGRPRLSFQVLVLWRCALLQTGFALLTVAGVLIAHRLSRRRPRVAWWWGGVAPVVWTWGAVGLTTVTFSELASRQLWTGAGWLAASGAALLALPVAITPVRARCWLAALVGCLVSLMAVVDLAYLRWFGKLAPLAAFAAVHQLGRVEGSVRAILAASTWWLAPAPLAGLIFGFLAPWFSGAAAPPARRRRVVLALVVLAVLAMFLPAGRSLSRALADRTVTEQVFSEHRLVGQWGLVNIHLLDLAQTIRRVSGTNELPEARWQWVQQFFRRRAAQALAHGPGFGAARGASVILIQVESLQQWIVGAKVGNEEITPFLNQLRQRALYFSSVFEQTAEGRSSDGEFVALNSLLPLSRGAVAFLRADDRFVALPGVLVRNGYSTLSAHAFERGFWNRAILHPRFGFERSVFQRDFKPGEAIGWGLADGAFFDQMVPRLAALPRPFCAFLITLGLHHPFDQFPRRHKVLDLGELSDTPLGNYIHAMHYFDGQLARFIAALERSGVLRDTVVALYGDHQSGLDLNARLLALAGAPRWEPSAHVRFRRVPFFVWLPGDALAREVPAVGGQVDIAPTLLHLLGLPRPGSFLGGALIPGREAVVALPDGSAVSADTMFVAQGPDIPEGGACFVFPTGAPLGRQACDSLAEQARQQIEASQLVLDHDLAERLAGDLQ